ncbi:MAG: hypothetical protein KC454_02905 [Flavobacteriales bacterium]|jgi:hypothetical protein|nr:hypothetical protein [Flavobacteriales bacterium]
MGNENEYIDRAQQGENDASDKKTKNKKRSKKRVKKQTSFVQILNGDFLTKEFMLNNLNFIFFIMFLLILTVGKGYYGKQLSRDVAKTQQELDEATSDYFEAKVSLEEKTQRTELVQQLESSGLKETVNPTKVIRIKKEK